VGAGGVMSELALVHHVNVGETPASIAECYGCDALDLVLANPQKRFAQLSSGDLVFVQFRAGEVILVPPGARPPPELSGGFMGQTPQLPNLDIPPIPTTFPPIAPGSDPEGLQAAAQAQILQTESAIRDPQSPMYYRTALEKLAAPEFGNIIGPGQLNAAKAAYDLYGAKSVAALVNIAQAAATGQPGSFTMMAPLVGVMLAAAGAAPVVGIVVAAGLAVLDVVAQAVNAALGGGASCNDTAHQWVLPGGMCITQSNGRPPGPLNPLPPQGDGKPNPAWTTWPVFEAGLVNPPPTPNAPDGRSPLQQHFAGGGFGPPYLIDNAFPNYAETIGCEMLALTDASFAKATGMGSGPTLFGGGGPDAQVANFFRTYYRAWQHANEAALNGYQAPDPWVVFSEVFVHWNASHPGPSVALVPTHYPSNIPLGACFSHGAPNDPNGASYIGALLSGDIDGKAHYQDLPKLNVGGGSAFANLITSTLGGGAAAAPTSTAKKLAVGGVVTGAGLAALWLALGRPASWAAFKAAFSHAWRSV
jgi:hypothetical protein